MGKNNRVDPETLKLLAYVVLDTNDDNTTESVVSNSGTALKKRRPRNNNHSHSNNSNNHNNTDGDHWFEHQPNGSRAGRPTPPPLGAAGQTQSPHRPPQNLTSRMAIARRPSRNSVDLGLLSRLNTGSTPPSYDLLAPLAPRYPILPREEEGREQLPGYAPSLCREQLLNRKLELISPFTSSSQRSWRAVHVELNNTQLNFYAALRKSAMGTLGVAGATKSYTYTVGKLLKSYTLQYADVGVAIDYDKRQFVIRVRAECEQFLLECPTQEDCIVWVNLLQMATDLALPLEERRLPKYRSIPRRTRNHRRRHRDQIEEAELVATVSANQAAIVAGMRPSSDMVAARRSIEIAAATRRSIEPSSRRSSVVRGDSPAAALPVATPTETVASRRSRNRDRPRLLTRVWHSFRHRSSMPSYPELSLAPVTTGASLCPTDTIASSYNLQPISTGVDPLDTTAVVPVDDDPAASVDPLDTTTKNATAKNAGREILLSLDTTPAPAGAGPSSPRSGTGGVDDNGGHSRRRHLHPPRIQFQPQLPPSSSRRARASIVSEMDDEESDNESIIMDRDHEAPQRNSTVGNDLGMDQSLFLQDEDDGAPLTRVVSTPGRVIIPGHMEVVTRSVSRTLEAMDANMSSTHLSSRSSANSSSTLSNLTNVTTVASSATTSGGANSAANATSTGANRPDKWSPPTRALNQEAFLRYAQRCLGSLPSKTPWLNKVIVTGGTKYLVRDNHLEKISSLRAH